MHTLLACALEVIVVLEFRLARDHMHVLVDITEELLAIESMPLYFGSSGSTLTPLCLQIDVETTRDTRTCEITRLQLRCPRLRRSQLSDGLYSYGLRLRRSQLSAEV